MILWPMSEVAASQRRNGSITSCGGKVRAQCRGAAVGGLLVPIVDRLGEQGRRFSADGTLLSSTGGIIQPAFFALWSLATI